MKEGGTIRHPNRKDFEAKHPLVETFVDKLVETQNLLQVLRGDLDSVNLVNVLTRLNQSMSYFAAEREIVAGFLVPPGSVRVREDAEIAALNMAINMVLCDFHEAHNPQDLRKAQEIIPGALCMIGPNLYKLATPIGKSDAEAARALR